ncbi:hypothetical protein [Arachidicoccus terrestris]|uniref:hypothetical protein n=1 Tax=Arachidicoccus terrestris TaxID=2875539 RepID=UPI001CC58645|nr:hypothetical protein [Arachidicoccus terrestris]UAY56246.1 hypothetical protein K9M52_04300 [Arachidicoccus terrestris]
MKTILDHISTLPEPYRSAAMEYIKSRPRAAQMKFGSLKNAIVWTLPAGMIKNNFWSQIFK